MDDPRAQRTLVKSPPELWAEISDAEALAGHLGAFGDIRITRRVPETTVAWEGDRARGTVELEPTGWGTRVTLTAELARVAETTSGPEQPVVIGPVAPQTAPEPPAPAPSPAPAQVRSAPEREESPASRIWRLLGRLFGRRPDTTPPADDRPADPPSPMAEHDAPARRPEAPPDEPPAPSVEPAERSSTTPAPLSTGRAEEILTGVLDDLGAAHHRPFSRG
jgi:hypothetical protein